MYIVHNLAQLYIHPRDNAISGATSDSHFRFVLVKFLLRPTLLENI